jgi:hypothetical protein
MVGRRVCLAAQYRSGFEGLAASPGGERLYALLEKPLFGAGGKPEGRFLRLLEFDAERRNWTGRHWRYALEAGATAIGDFNLIDERRALVSEPTTTSSSCCGCPGC